MNKSFNTILNAGEGPKWCNFRNSTSHNLARNIALFNSGPGINFGTFDRESNFLFLFIDTENLDFYFLANLEYFTWMIDTTPGELADVYQPVGTSQVNKGAKVGKVTHHTMANFTCL